MWFFPVLSSFCIRIRFRRRFIFGSERTSENAPWAHPDRPPAARRRAHLGTGTAAPLLLFLGDGHRQWRAALLRCARAASWLAGCAACACSCFLSCMRAGLHQRGLCCEALRWEERRAVSSPRPRRACRGWGGASRALRAGGAAFVGSAAAARPALLWGRWRGSLLAPPQALGWRGSVCAARVPPECSCGVLAFSGTYGILRHLLRGNRFPYYWT